MGAGQPDTPLCPHPSSDAADETSPSLVAEKLGEARSFAGLILAPPSVSLCPDPPSSSTGSTPNNKVSPSHYSSPPQLTSSALTTPPPPAPNSSTLQYSPP